MYFARKFEPIINLSIIDTLEVWLFGDYPAGNSNIFVVSLKICRVLSIVIKYTFLF